MIIGVTGHRNLHHNKEDIKFRLLKHLLEYQPKFVITGMALGFDLLAAETCVENNFPFVAAIPFKEQTKLWQSEDVAHYNELLAKAAKSVIVSPGGYTNWKLLERNKWIVSHSHLMIGYWSGEQKGGTWHCLKNAKRVSREIINIYHQGN